MLPTDFKRIISSFTDERNDVEIRNGRLVAQIHDELIDVGISQHASTGELRIDENGTTSNARQWFATRIARLPQLAERLLSNVPVTEYFVNPAGKFRDDLANSADDNDAAVDDVVAAMRRRLSNPLVGTTSVLYLTSDAGEGKTTLINHLARSQAQEFRRKSSHWLLVPIPLGGKAFLNFDDVVVAALVNRLRFSHYYYEGFLELVRLNMLVPAFDGFEEMFIEGSSGEAVSALGNLVGSLESSGTVVVAARKAFFEYQSFRTQARLFDSISRRSASFSRMGIMRWGRKEFLDYAIARGEPNGEQIYEAVLGRFEKEDHPLLTRAVLVKRLFDVVSSIEDVYQLIEKLGSRPQDYFFGFVNAIVQREAHEKWLNKAGDAQEPLLSIEQHHGLLSSIASEMWQSSVFALRYDIIDVIVDLFVEEKKLGAVVGRQVKERIKQHSLLAADSSKSSLLSFDHDDFRLFFLGEALGKTLASGVKSDVYLMLAVGYMAGDVLDQALQYLERHSTNLRDVIVLLNGLSSSETTLSFASENAGGLVIRILGSRGWNDGVEICRTTFPTNSLLSRRLAEVRFVDCRFQPTEIGRSQFANVTFVNCDFERVDVDEHTNLHGVRLEQCRISGLQDSNNGVQLFNPYQIDVELTSLGASVDDELDPRPPEAEDTRIKLLVRFLRIFLRTTEVDEDTIQIRLGRNAGEFFGNVLPPLLRAGVLKEVPHRGSGVQRRFRLQAKMQEIERALAQADTLDSVIFHLSGASEDE